MVMLWAIKQLFAPLRYLRIRQGEKFFESKVVYDWIFPVGLGVITLWVDIKFAPAHEIFGEKGIIGGFQKLLEILVPFFIAALAAVATFERKGLDEVMKGHPAVLTITRATGEEAEHVLTRRQFVSYLFGYLSFVSLFLFVVILVLRLVEAKTAPIFAGWFGEYRAYFKGFVMFVFLVPIWQVIVTTLVGVYFMSERLQVMDDPQR